VGTIAASHLGDEELAAYWFDRLSAKDSTFGAILCGAGFAEILSRRGRPAEAAALLHDALQFGERPRGHVFTVLAVARYGAAEDFVRARKILESAGDAPTELVERHALPLFDALVAQREGRSDDAIRNARHAAPGLRRLGFPLLEAAALELAQEPAAALEVYQRCGATYDVRRLAAEPTNILDSSPTVPTRALPPDRLSARERTIATLVSTGLSNMKIGRTLFISHKTVEKHLSAMYKKLDISSRSQLSAYATRFQSGR